MNLDEIRLKINDIDDQLIRLYMERMDTVMDVARYKLENNKPVLDQSREDAIICRLSGKVPPERAVGVKALYSTLFDLSRSEQIRLIHKDGPSPFDSIISATPDFLPERATVACQGVEGSYAHAATKRLFSIPEISYFSRFEGVFQAVDQGLCRYGILPLENSTAGSVTEVYDLMKKYSFTIVRSVRLRVSHRLMALPGSTLNDIREVYSHEQALRQCSGFLDSHPEIRVIPCANTAVAAKMVAASGRKDMAAIGSTTAGALYGLHTVSEAIQNNPHNYTRFICISRTPEIYPGADRISLMTALPHVTGSLSRTISKFAVLGLNLLKLESRPMPGSDFEFMFYFDFEGSVRSESVKTLLKELSAEMDHFTYLGNYSEVLG